MRHGWPELFCLHHQHWASPACGEETESGIGPWSVESTWWFWLGFFGMNIPKDEYPWPLSFLFTLPFRLTLCTPALSLLLNPFHPFPLPSCDYLSFPTHWSFCCGYDTPPSAQHPPGLAVLSNACICRRSASLFSCRTALNLVLHLSSKSLN